MRGALLDVPGVVSAEVDCSSGRAVCAVQAGTDPAALVGAVEAAGYASTLVDEPAEPGQ